MSNIRKKAAWIGALALLLSGCHGQPHSSAPGAELDHQHIQTNGSVPTMVDASKAAEEAGSIKPVNVKLVNTQGKEIGKAELTQAADGVKIKVEAASLTPGAHGIHFHQIGKCEAPDFKSSGDHFNPLGKKHGTANPEGPHAGDLPNLEVGADGKASTVLTSNLVTLLPGKPNSLLKTGGSSLIIHEKADDYKTDPAGNSGARIACGVIQ